MILQKMTLENFRQFYGKQELEFIPSGEPNRNITVLFGENGRGKTGLFRAIVFCLYGERRLSQDGDVPDKELQLVNMSAIQANPGKPVEASVELIFTHKGETYNLRRAIMGMSEGSNVIEEVTDIRLRITGVDGNTRVIDPKDINDVIDRVLDRRVKEYFLFDGEKIERLTRVGVEQRREIGRGIRNLLNIDALESAIRAVRRVVKLLEDDLAKSSSSEQLYQLIQRLRENEEAKDGLEKKLEQLGEERRKALKEIEITDKRLEEFKEIRHLLEKRKAYEQELQTLEQQASEAMRSMRNMVCKGAVLIIAPTVMNVFEYIERQKRKGDIPSEIRRDLIQRILDEHRCICGNEICEGTDAHKNILEWYKRTSDAAVQDAALNLWRYLGDICHHFSDDEDLIQKRIIEHSNLIQAMDNIHFELDRLSNEIGGSERQDATELDAHRSYLQKSVTMIEAHIQNLETQLKQLESEHERLLALLNEAKRKADRNDELARRSLLARETLDALNSVYLEFTNEIKNVIGETATKIFKRLLDDEGRMNLPTIIVNDDYSLEVLDRWGRPFLANISAGQRQIMSIAFIAALAMAASRHDRIEMPLFMDTPFGRLSYEHRKNLIKEVSALSSQWIILATDTEFRRQEDQLLKATGNWGKFFFLRGTDDGNTRVEEKDINTVYAILRSEEDYL